MRVSLLACAVFLLTTLPLHAQSSGKCLNVENVETLPFKGETVDDITYNSFISEGERSFACLINQISNENLMNDPRKAPPFEGIRAGDVALFIIADISGKPIDQLIGDESFKKLYETKGMYGYFEYIQNSGKREELKKELSKAFNIYNLEKGKSSIHSK